MRFCAFLFAVVVLALSSAASRLYGSGQYIHGEKQLKFILLTDLHVSPGTASETDLKRIVDEINTLAVDFVVVTGDLTNSGSDQELLAVKSALERLLSLSMLFRETMRRTGLNRPD